MDIYILYYLAAGAISGLLAGFFGIGGGMIIVPILTFLKYKASQKLRLHMLVLVHLLQPLLLRL